MWTCERCSRTRWNSGAGRLCPGCQILCDQRQRTKQFGRTAVAFFGIASAAGGMFYLLLRCL